MTRYALDTDMATLLLRGHPTVCSRAAEHDPGELAITIVTVEEILTGWYTQIRRAKKDDQLERAYEALQQAALFVGRVHILGFSKEAIKKFRSLRSSHPRAGANDLKIAAIVKTHTATLVTRNRSDFSAVPGLQVEDWSR